MNNMDCIFCKIIAGEIPAKILKETSLSISFLDAFPLAKGHVLVIPKNHHQKIQNMRNKFNMNNRTSKFYIPKMTNAFLKFTSTGFTF